MGGRGRFEAAQARALGVEEPRRREHGRAVFEQREQFDGARVALEQRPRDGPPGVGVGGARLVEQFAGGGERVRQLGACPLAVRGESRHVPAVDAAAGDL